MSGDLHSQSEENIFELTQQAIKDLPTLQQKVQAIALNGYNQAVRDLKDNLQNKKRSIQFKLEQQKQLLLHRISLIIEGSVDVNESDLEDVNHLFTQQQLDIRKEMRTGNKIQFYWLRVLLNNYDSKKLIQKQDQHILKYLKDIKAFKNQDKTLLTVKFFFAPNEYFTNKVITKNFKIDKDELTFESFGDKINWRQETNENDNQGKKNIRDYKLIRQTSRKQSFFNLFEDIRIDPEQDQFEDQNQLAHFRLEAQHEFAIQLHEDIIPNSIIYYLGIKQEQQYSQKQLPDYLSKKSQERRSRFSSNQKRSASQRSKSNSPGRRSKSKSQKRKNATKSKSSHSGNNSEKDIQKLQSNKK